MAPAKRRCIVRPEALLYVSVSSAELCGEPGADDSTVQGRPAHERYAAETRRPRNEPPLVRAASDQPYRTYVKTHILPVFGAVRLDAITVTALEAFRMGLIDKATGKGLAVKTARDMIDGSFRALFRDARKEGLVT